MPINTTPPEKFVGIAGGSCSGKTTLERNLEARLGDRITVFPFDDMFVGLPALKGKSISDWEDPNLYRWDDFKGHLRNIKLGRAVTIVANSRESKEAGIDNRFIEPRPIIAVVGFLALYDPQITKLFDTKIFLDLPEEEIIRRRLHRADPDSPWDGTDYIHTMLIPGHRRVVVPQRKVANHVIDATLSPEAITEEILKIIG